MVENIGGLVEIGLSLRAENSQVIGLPWIAQCPEWLKTPAMPDRLASVAQSNGFNSASNALVGQPTAILTLCNESIGRRLLDRY
jgi:hypothetical protein